MESILAIMVISCSLALILASLQAIAPSIDLAADLEREAESWSIKILSMTTDDGSTIRRSSLGRAQSISSGPISCNGVRCEIQTLGQETFIVPIISIGKVLEPAAEAVLYAMLSLDNAPILSERYQLVHWKDNNHILLCH